MKREEKIVLEKSIDSLVLSIDHFNRPWDKGRHEAVLIFLDRAFELLLKGAIVHRGGRIREPRAKETLGFDKCVRKCLSDKNVKCLSEDDAFTIQTINSLRDAAQHYFLDISEQLLYLYMQAGFTLFGKLLKEVFGKELLEYFPERVLPVSTSSPKDFAGLIKAEFKDIKELVTPGKRRRILARAKLRALVIIEESLSGVRSQPSENKLGRLLRRIKEGKNWPKLFPGISTLMLDSSGKGINVSLKITKKEGEPVHLIPEGTPGATVVAIRRVNELSYYSLGLIKLAEKLGITAPKTLALIRHLGLQSSKDYFKEIRVGSSSFKRYSSQALDVLKENLSKVDMNVVWKKYRPKPSVNKST